jgi:hypothetical protein
MVNSDHSGCDPAGVRQRPSFSRNQENAPAGWGGFVSGRRSAGFIDLDYRHHAEGDLPCLRARHFCDHRLAGLSWSRRTCVNAYSDDSCISQVSRGESTTVVTAGISSSMSTYVFTVSTQTYNRRDRLPGVYNSLRSQTFRDFEWVIVDDGSTDGTDDLVTTWQREADFPIRYFYQPNRGKHVGFNWAVKQAAGELLLSFDSDDSCVPNALERFKFHWDSIPNKEEYSTVSALCMDEGGNLIGTAYPKNVIDVDSFTQQYRFRAAERWGINRTAVLRKYPFPEVPGERFVPEALVWNRLAMKYKARFINEKLRIYTPTPCGLMASLGKTRMASPQSARLYYMELSEMPLPLHEKTKALMNYIRFSFHAHIPMSDLLGEGVHRLLAASLLPAGYLAYQRDRYQLCQD